MCDPKNRSVADLMRIDEMPDWADDDLALMLTEQLDLSIGDFVNQSIGGGKPPDIPKPEEAAETLRGLLSSKDPDLSLLQRIKDAAKMSAEHPLWPLPDAVAHTIYIASIAAAELNLGEHISKLEREDYDRALERCSASLWVSDEIRSLCRSTRELRR